MLRRATPIADVTNLTPTTSTSTVPIKPAASLLATSLTPAVSNTNPVATPIIYTTRKPIKRKEPEPELPPGFKGLAQSQIAETLACPGFDIFVQQLANQVKNAGYVADVDEVANGKQAAVDPQSLMMLANFLTEMGTAALGR
jgi:hypothetical protein